MPRSDKSNSSHSYFNKITPKDYDKTNTKEKINNETIILLLPQKHYHGYCLVILQAVRNTALTSLL